MIIISTRDFRANQSKFLEMAKNGIDIILKSRGKGSFKLVPVTDDDTLMSKDEFSASIEHSLSQVKDGKTFAMKEGESLDEFINRMKLEGHL